MRQSEDAKQFKFIQDVEGFVALANSCQSAGILFDSWNWFCGGGTDALLDTIGLDRILAVWLGDCVDGVAPEAATESDCLLPASTGVIDNPGYLRKFAAVGLRVPVSAMGRLAAPGGTRRDVFVGKIQDALNRCFEEAGLPVSSRKPEAFAATSSFAGNSA